MEKELNNYIEKNKFDDIGDSRLWAVDWTSGARVIQGTDMMLQKNELSFRFETSDGMNQPPFQK